MTSIAHQLAEQLKGKVCENFRLIEGGTLILFFESVTAQGIGKESRFWIDCAWRLFDEDQMVVGSLDEPTAVLTALARIQGQELISIQVDNNSKDVRLTFLNKLCVEAFCYSVQDDQWEFRRADGYRLGIGANLEPFERWEKGDQEIA